MSLFVRLLFWLGFLALMMNARAQQAPLTIGQTVEQALEKYPATRASLEQVSAAAAGINLARAAYLPRADFLAQLNRATRNNVFGLLLPQSLISGISGPVLGTNDLTNVWGSTTGVLVSWEPFDFGLRGANVGVAEAARLRAEAEAGVTRLQVAAAAGDAFLTILAAEQTVRAAQAGVERARVLNDVVGALVRSELRPGAEAARTRAELALAQTQEIQAEQAVAVARASLSQLLGAAPAALEPGRLLDLPPELPAPEQLAKHPLAVEQNAAIEEAKAREHALDRSYFPRFNLQATAYARGTGARPDGGTGGAFSGFGPNIQNWALGMTVTFPALELPALRARRQIEAHRERAEAARYDQVLQDLRGQVEKARAAMEGARRVAANTPIQLEAARAAEQQASARYRAGLGTVVEVAEAQRLLTQAEIDDALARLNVWRAALNLAAARGDLAPFLDSAGKGR